MSTVEEFEKERELIKKALKLFPQIVREKKRAHKKREKIIGRFMKLARELYAREKKMRKQEEKLKL